MSADPIRPTIVSPDTNRYPFWVLAFIILTAIVILYSVSLGHNFLFDEENIILNNPTIRSFSRIPDLLTHGYFYFENRPQPRWDEYYRPLTSLTLMADYHFWGVNPLGYNLTNLFLHLILCTLYFSLLADLLKNRIAAFLAALLYAVHTIHTEAVTYTASRGDILGLLLIIAAMLLYLRGRPLVSLFCYSLALFSKETMIMLPIYIVLLDRTVLKNQRRDLSKNTGPFFLVMACFYLFRKFLCPIPSAPMPTDLRGALLRMLGMGDGILQYLRALVSPDNFKPFSDVPELYGFSDPLIWTAVTVGALLMAAWLLSLRYRGLAFLGMSIFLVGLVPHFQVVHVYPEWAEHYICISSLGLFLLLGLLFRNAIESRKKVFAVFLFAVYVPFLFFISLRTWQRNEIYADTQRYYNLLAQTDTPYRFFGYQQLALNSLREGKPDEAFVPLHVALQQEFRSDCTHQLLGLYYTQKNRPQKALHEFRLAYFYSGGNSLHLQQIGNTLVQLRRYKEASKIYVMAQRLSPQTVTSYVQLASVYELLGQYTHARQCVLSGMTVLKNQPEAQATLLMTLARSEYRQGHIKHAQKLMEEILKKYSYVPGTADLARLCLGHIDAQRFSRLAKLRYPHYQKTLPAFILMSYVMRGKKAEVMSEIASARKIIMKLASLNALYLREIRCAEQFLRGKLTF